MFRLELFPAREGDALVLSWGDAAAPRRLLVDAGRRATAGAIRDYARRSGLSVGAFELFIITHVDRDHIEGAVQLLRDATFRPLVQEVWFNGRTHLDADVAAPGFETYGALDGERISQALRQHSIPWNARFGGRAVALVEEALPQFELPEGLTVTLLSPDLQQLAALSEPWDETVEAARPGWESLGPEEPIAIERLAAVRFSGDRARPNASSIALVAEYDGRHVMLTGDAHVPRLLRSLALYGARQPRSSAMALVKAPHHGSRGNISADLVKAVRCPCWAISTNGDQFRHPDAEAIARILVHSPGTPELYFNYRSPETEMWRRPTHPRLDFAVHYGEAGYISIDVPAPRRPRQPKAKRVIRALMGASSPEK